MAEVSHFSTEIASSKTAGEGDREAVNATVSAPLRLGHGFNNRSCITCRQRKVRCGKSHPCSNCIRAGIECVYPGPGREKRDAKKPPDPEMACRLQKLEDVIHRLGGQIDDESRGHRARGFMPLADGSGVPPSSHSSTFGEDNGPAGPSSVKRQLGRLVVNAGQSQYVSGSFWANPGDQSTEMREIFDTPSVLDETETSLHGQSPGTRSPLNHGGFVFGYALTSDDLRTLHPSQNQSFVLLLIFEENCDPIVKITHRPTVRKMFLKTANGLEHLSKAEEALLFAIYYGAACSLTPRQCQNQLGEEQEKLTSRFRLAVEQALSRASFMTTPTILTMQALVLFLIFLRSQDDMRMVWSLNGLATHLARSLGVHRDGTKLNLRPFETEMRRRLWWQISTLDSRSTEDQGVEPSFTEAFYDAKLPLNINDDDISLETEQPPKERGGTTEMTFCLIRFELSQTTRRISSELPPMTLEEANNSANYTAEAEEWIEGIRRRIQAKYLQHCDMTVPYVLLEAVCAMERLMGHSIYWASATVGKLILAKLWLMVYHPLQYSRSDSHGILTPHVRDRLFLASVELIEYCCLLENHERTAKWAWLFRTYMQWHALAFVLSELYHDQSRTDGDRAWRVIDTYYEKRVLHCPPNQKSMLWQPLQQLMDKARASREASKLGPGLGTKSYARNSRKSPLDARAGVSSLDTLFEQTIPAPAAPAAPYNDHVQTQKFPKHDFQPYSLLETDMASSQVHKGFSRNDEETFSLPDGTNGTFDPGDVTMAIQEFAHMQWPAGVDDWL